MMVEIRYLLVLCALLLCILSSDVHGSQMQVEVELPIRGIFVESIETLWTSEEEIVEVFGQPSQTAESESVTLLLWEDLGIRASVGRAPRRVRGIRFYCGSVSDGPFPPRRFEGRVGLDASSLHCSLGRNDILREGLRVARHGHLIRSDGELIVTVVMNARGGTVAWIEIADLRYPVADEIESLFSRENLAVAYVKRLRASIADGAKLEEVPLPAIKPGAEVEQEDFDVLGELLGALWHDAEKRDDLGLCDVAQAIYFFGLHDARAATDKLINWLQPPYDGRTHCIRESIHALGEGAYPELLSCAENGSRTFAEECLRLLEEEWPGGEWMRPGSIEEVRRRAGAWREHFMP